MIPSFSLLEIVTEKEYSFLFISIFKISEVDTDLKGRFVSFKLTPFNESSLLVPLHGIAPESSWLGSLFEGLQNHTQNKNKGSENKKMLGDLNCTKDKIDRNGENKTQILYRCCSNYALSKVIVDNWLEDQNPLNSPATIGHLPKIQDRQGLYCYLY